MHTFHRIATITALLLTTAATGCDKKEESSATDNSSAAKATGAAPTPAADVGAVNQLVPDGLELSFETATIDDDVEAVVPVGWEASTVIPGRYRPTSGLGFMTSYKVGTNCDGYCKPKDWKAVVDEVELGRLEGKTIEKDEQLPGGRLVVAKDGDKVTIIAAWWKDGADHYVYCRADLDDEATRAAAAFEAACRQTRATDW